MSVDGTAPDGTEVSDDLDTPVVVSTDLTPSMRLQDINDYLCRRDAGVQW